MLKTGSREFDAYTRTLRRIHYAKRLERSAEAMQAARPQLDLYDVLFGEVAVQPQLVDGRKR